MKEQIRRAGGGVAALLASVIGVGCTDEETGFFIRGNLVLEPPECVGQPEADAVLHADGELDVELSRSYEAFLLVGNQLAARGDKENLRTETMITNITGAEVQLYRDDGSLDAEFTAPATGVIRPDSSAEPGFGIVNTTIIP